jgi:hypothetical protein
VGTFLCEGEWMNRILSIDDELSLVEMTTTVFTN